MRRSPLVVAAVVAASCAQGTDVDRVKAELIALDNQWAATMPDVAKFSSYFAADGVLAMPGAPELKGPAAIQSAMAPIASLPGFSMKWKATGADASVSGDLGYTVGTYEMTMNNAAGIPTVEKGKYQTTWKKIGGAWKVVWDGGSADAPTPISSAHVMMPPAKVTWNDGPPNLPAGVKIALLSGDPSGPGHFTVRVQFPAGARVPPHWHPNDEHVTVLSGTLAVGMGKAWDDKAMTDMPAGSYVVTSATMAHYALAKAATTIQVSGMGPFVTNYVNPADDPSKR